LLGAAALSMQTWAAETPYVVQAGDILQVSVWKETDLQAEVLVRPDGGISFPLAGEISAAGHSIEDIRAQIDQRLRKYIPEPVVTVALKVIGGNRIYVLGKVSRPGDFALARPLDVMQALSLAGGATPYANLDDIQILRREGDHQVALSFSYGDVGRGKRLAQNVLLQSGDTVVVP
jgi:polysaccharide export outer membrane protein